MAEEQGGGLPPAGIGGEWRLGHKEAGRHGYGTTMLS